MSASISGAMLSIGVTRPERTASLTSWRDMSARYRVARCGRGKLCVTTPFRPLRHWPMFSYPERAPETEAQRPALPRRQRQSRSPAERSFRAHPAEPRARAKQRRSGSAPGATDLRRSGAAASRPSALIVKNPSQRSLSLIWLKISLIRRFNSLIGLKKFPVRSHRELTHKGLIQHAILPIDLGD